MMHIAIYQLRSDNEKLFRAYEESKPVTAKGYVKVYEDKIFQCNSLEDVYAIFNFSRPEGFKGHSLSVSDVVKVISSEKVEPGYYFCDSIGFVQIDFDKASA